MKGGRASQKAGLRLMCKKWPFPESGHASLTKKPHLDTKTESCLGGRKCATSSLASSSVLQLGTLPTLLDQWRSTTSNRLVHKMSKGHHLQFRLHPLLFHNFKLFNIKAAMAHHPLIQKEADEPLSKGAIEPATGSVGFYSNVFVVLKCIGGL